MVASMQTHSQKWCVACFCSAISVSCGGSSQPSQTPQPSGMTWRTSSAVESNFSYEPIVALDESGSTQVIWSVSNQQSGAKELVARRFVLGGNAPGATFVIHSGVGTNIFCYRATSENNDNVTVIWLQNDFGAGSRIMASRYTGALEDWEPPVELQRITGTVSCPKILADKSGNTLAVWDVIRTDATAGTNVTDIYSAYRPVGNAWDIPRLVASDSVGFASLHPEFAMNGNGTAVAVWESYTGPIRSAFFTPTSGWSNVTELESTSGGERQQVVMDGAGNVLFLWIYRDQAFARFYRPGPGWSAVEAISTIDDVARTCLKVTERGEGSVVWTTYSSGMSTVWARSFSTATGSLSPPQLLQHPAAPFGNWACDIDGEGSVSVLWNGIYNYASSLYATRFVPSSGWQTSVTMYSGSLSNSQVSLDVSENGKAVAAWESWGVYVNFYY